MGGQDPHKSRRPDAAADQSADSQAAPNSALTVAFRTPTAIAGAVTAGVSWILLSIWLPQTAAMTLGILSGCTMVLALARRRYIAGASRMVMRAKGSAATPPGGTGWAIRRHFATYRETTGNSGGGTMQLLLQPIDESSEAANTASVVLPRRAWYGYNSTAKRALDLMVAAAVLLVSWPIWLATIVAIKVDSPGPAIFAQERVGLHGRRFQFYKFRSMEDGADRMKKDLAHLSEVDGPVFKLRVDPRVTRVGKFLRRTSLDELPQFINVLRGEMSLVGPRPPVPEEVAQYRPSDMIRLAVKPGLTCWWQVRGRWNVDFDTWMAFDREYVYGLSFWVDVQIIVRTIGTIARRREVC